MCGTRSDPKAKSPEVSRGRFGTLGAKVPRVSFLRGPGRFDTSCALMEALLAKAQEAGYKTLILWTAGPLEAAIRQYERFGFRVVETSENRTWRPDGEPVVEIKMEKTLEA